jgi:hypothetical protein
MVDCFQGSVDVVHIVDPLQVAGQFGSFEGTGEVK